MASAIFGARSIWVFEPLTIKTAEGVCLLLYPATFPPEATPQAANRLLPCALASHFQLDSESTSGLIRLSRGEGMGAWGRKAQSVPPRSTCALTRRHTLMEASKICAVLDVSGFYPTSSHRS